MSDDRTEKDRFIDSLIDNEKVLAKTIEAGEKSDEEITADLGFDQAQIDTMRSRLAEYDKVDEAEEANVDASNDATDTAADTTEGGDDAEKTEPGENETVVGIL